MTGGGGGWVDPLSSGAGLQIDNPVTSAQAQINKYLNMINASGNQGAMAGARNAAGGGGHHNWFSSIVSALDLPRAAVVSGIDTAIKGGGFNQWLKGTEGHMTAGHVLNDLGVHNHLVDSLGGIAGDVALDPLTYLGGFGEIGRTAGALGHVAEAVSGADKAARLAESAQEADRVLQAARSTGLPDSKLATLIQDSQAKRALATEAAGQAHDLTGGGVLTGDTFNRLKTQGLGGLNEDERAILSQRMGGADLRTGIAARVPGTKLAGAPVHIPLVSGELTDPLTRAIKDLGSRIGDSNVMKGISEKFVTQGGIKNSIRSAALEGDGERAAALTNLLRLAPESAGVARETVNEFGPQFKSALDQIPDGVKEHIPAAMEGDLKAQAAIAEAGGTDGLNSLREAYDGVRQRAAETGVPIPKMENYFPHQLTEMAREKLSSSPQQLGKARKSFEGALKRNYKQGDQFLGQQLQDGSIEEMNSIAHDVYGKDAFDLFKSDPKEITAQYLNGISRRIGEQHLANRLDDMGVTLQGDMALPHDSWQAMADQMGTLAKSNKKFAKTSAKLAQGIGEGSGMAADQGSPRGPLSDFLTPEEVAYTKTALTGTTATARKAPEVMQRAATKGVQDELARRAFNPANKTKDLTDLMPGQVLKNGQARLLSKSEHAAWTNAAAKGSGTRFNLNDLVQNSDQLKSLLEQHAQSSAEAAQRLSKGRQALSGIIGQNSSDLASLGATGADAGRVAPQFVKDALAKMRETQLAANKKSTGLLGWYDKALNVWKQYELAMPGKAIRHMVAGPAWNSYLGNVGSSSLREGFSAWRAFQHGGLDAVAPEMRDEIQQSIQSGIYHGHDFGTHEITGPQTLTGKINAKIHNPLSTRQGYFAKNQEVQRRGQDYWRFAMYHDALKKGMAAPEAARKVRMMLGDPHNITAFERSTARRAVPFYTFLRQNLPVELGSLAKQPGKFINAYEAPKQEIEQWSPKQGIVPTYFGDTMSIRLPWEIGGNRTYLSPDLPFTRIGALFAGKNQLASQTSPLIQDVIAAVDNANTFTGQPFSPSAKQAPGAWSKIPGLMEALHLIAPGSVMRTTKASTDFGVTTPAGQWVITPKAESIIESLIPPLGQSRRLFTTEPNMKARGDTTLLADLVGQNFRTNDPSQQAAELYRRESILKAIIEGLQNKGQLPKYIYGFKP